MALGPAAHQNVAKPDAPLQPHRDALRRHWSVQDEHDCIASVQYRRPYFGPIERTRRALKEPNVRDYDDLCIRNRPQPPNELRTLFERVKLANNTMLVEA